MDCTSCRESRELISRHVHEADMDRMERANKRLFWALIVSLVLLVGCIVWHFWYESQWEDVTETTTFEVEQEADGDGSNSFVGGNYYGTAESQGNEDNDEEA